MARHTSQRYKHLGEGVHRDLETGKVIYEKASSKEEKERWGVEKKKSAKIIGYIDPDRV